MFCEHEFLKHSQIKGAYHGQTAEFPLRRRRPSCHPHHAGCGFYRSWSAETVWSVGRPRNGRVHRLLGNARYTDAGTEFFGGIALLIGLATRLISVPLVVTMLVASFGVHGSAFFASAKGMEYSLTLALVTAGFIFTGAGRFSIDALFRRDTPEPVQV